MKKDPETMESVGARVARELSEHFQGLERHDAVVEQNKKRAAAASALLEAIIMREIIAFNQVTPDGCKLEWTKPEGSLTLTFRGNPTLQIVIEPGVVKLTPTEQNTSDSEKISFFFWHGEGGLEFQPVSAEDTTLTMSEENFTRVLLHTACNQTVKWAAW